MKTDGKPQGLLPATALLGFVKVNPMPLTLSVWLLKVVSPHQLACMK